jgi:hypothetical protein
MSQSQSYSFDPATGERQEFESSSVPSLSWTVGDDSDADPHNDESEVGDELPDAGPVPGNIVTRAGCVPGPFSRSRLGL